MTRNLRSWLVVGTTTLLVAFLGACSGNERASSPATPSSSQTFTDTTLANGLRVILAESPGSGLIASTVFIRAGAVRELSGIEFVRIPSGIYYPAGRHANSPGPGTAVEIHGGP